MPFTLVTAPTGGYLGAVRRVLATADDALVCVAFAQARGVHLLADELSGVARRGTARVVVTTTLGTSSAAALSALTDCRAELRVLNPGGATYHPKVFLGRKGDAIRAVVGSANLTSGLVANVEAGTELEGTMQQQAVAALWTWAEGIWNDPRVVPWRAPRAPAVDEEIEPELLAQLVAIARESPTVYTLGPTPRPNLVRDVTAAGLWVETERSRKLQSTRGRAAAARAAAHAQSGLGCAARARPADEPRAARGVARAPFELRVRRAGETARGEAGAGPGDRADV